MSVCNCNSCKEVEIKKAENIKISHLWKEAGIMASTLRQIVLIGEVGTSNLAKGALDGWDDFMGVKKLKRARKRKS